LLISFCHSIVQRAQYLDTNTLQNKPNYLDTKKIPRIPRNSLRKEMKHSLFLAQENMLQGIGRKSDISFHFLENAFQMCSYKINAIATKNLG